MKTIQTKHGKVSISAGAVSGLTFASLTNHQGEELPLFAWMPEDGSAVEDKEFFKELACMVAAGDSTPEGGDFWRLVMGAWEQCKKEQNDFFLAIDGL